MIQITQFTKKCHIHKISMTWEGGQAKHAGWTCPKCLPRPIVCPKHFSPYRCPGRKSQKTCCRECARVAIAARPERWHEFTRSGVAIVNGTYL